MTSHPKAFISYSWESQEHQDKVLGLADLLEVNGVEVLFDQYDPNPSKTWPMWMEEGLRMADFVICVCTASYKRRVEKQEGASTGLGLQWEGSLIYNSIASGQQTASKYQVVQFDEEVVANIPSPLSGNNRFVVTKLELQDPGIENLYRIITNQPKVTRPSRGQLKVLEPRERLVVPRSGGETTGTRIEISQPSSRNVFQTTINVKPSTKRFKPSNGKGTFLARAANLALSHASDALREDNFRESLALSLKALQFDRSNTRSSYYIANSFYRLHDFKQALKWLPIAISNDQSDIDLQYHELVAKFHLGELLDPFDQAAAIFESSQKDESDVLSYARFMADLDKYDEAIAIIESIPAEKRSVPTLSSLAVYFWFQNRTAEAVELLESLPKSEFRATDWINLGVGRAELNRFGLAIEAINEGLRRVRDHQFASYALAQIYALMGEEATAIAKLRELMEMDSIYLSRVEGERTFGLIRDSAMFKEFLADLKAHRETMSAVGDESI